MSFLDLTMTSRQADDRLEQTVKSGDGDDAGVTSYFTMNEIRTKIVSISAHQHVISPFTESFQLVLSSPS